MPSARASTETAVNPGFRRRFRPAYRTSREKELSILNGRGAPMPVRLLVQHFADAHRVQIIRQPLAAVEANDVRLPRLAARLRGCDRAAEAPVAAAEQQVKESPYHRRSRPPMWHTIRMVPRPHTSLERPTRVRYWVIVFAVTLAIVTYIDRVCISIAAPAITDTFHLSAKEMGWVFLIFNWSYAVFEIPGGFLGDRIGPRKVLTRIVVW